MSPEDFRKYLATEVLSEQRTISFRTLARALKVHTSAAKCMLYEFYETENKKRLRTIYATYVLSGTKRRPQPPAINGNHGSNDNQDQPMASSPPPFPSSMMSSSQQESHYDHEERDTVPVKTITLVREEDLEMVKEDHETITSIHIYSVSSHKLQDLVVLTDVSRDLYSTYHTNEDPLIHNKTYGVIQNPEVRRRKGKRPIIADAAPSAFKAVKDEPKATAAKHTSQTAAVKKEEPARPGSSGSATSAASGKQPGLKRDNSDFFKKAFGKSSGPKLQRNDTNACASGTEDTKVTGPKPDDEGESEDEALFLDTGTHKPATSKKRVSDVKKERADKAAKLRKMMDSDDDDEDKGTAKAVPGVEPASGAGRDTSATKPGGAGGGDAEDAAEDVAWSDSDTEQQRQTAPGKDILADRHQRPSTDANVVTEPPKRRRGRRKVMKKKTMKDEDGYLVTKEEAVWESFSESEPDVSSVRVKADANTGAAKGRQDDKSKSGVGGKGASQGKSVGKGAAKSGAAAKGGNIMNFFGKK